MRTLLYHTIVSDDTIVGIGGASLGGVGSPRVYQAGALGIGHVSSKPARPFMLISELPSISYPVVRDNSPTAKSHFFQIWVYDDRGDMTVIDTILAATEKKINGKLDGVISSTGALCLSSSIQGISQDLVDPEFDLSSRFLTVRLTSNK